MRIINQNVPSELFADYCKSLRPSFEKWKNKFNTFKFNQRRFGTGPNIFYARKRSAFRLPHMQGLGAGCPSGTQVEVRRAFRKCVTAFGCTFKWVDDIDAYGYGPHSRTFWHNLAKSSGMWYFNFFIALTWQSLFDFLPPPWCKFSYFDDTYVANGTLGDPDTNYSNSAQLVCGFDYSAPDVQSGEAHIYLRIHAGPNVRLLSEFALHCFSGSSFVDVYAIDRDKLNVASVTWNTRPPRVEHLGRIYLWHTPARLIIPLGHFTYDPDTWARIDTIRPLLNKTISSCIELAPVKLKPEPTPGVASALYFRSLEYAGADHALLYP